MISSRKVDSSQTPKYYKYATSNVGESTQGEGKERIVRVQEAAADPLEPPKFRQKKVHWTNILLSSLSLFIVCSYHLREAPHNKLLFKVHREN
jgi:hypothetical protein